MLGFLCMSAWSFLQRKGLRMERERGCGEVKLPSLLPLKLGPRHSRLACFVVNDKKPEGNVPSKHLNNCLEYGFPN